MQNCGIFLRKMMEIVAADHSFISRFLCIILHFSFSVRGNATESAWVL